MRVDMFCYLLVMGKISRLGMYYCWLFGKYLGEDSQCS